MKDFKEYEEKKEIKDEEKKQEETSIKEFISKLSLLNLSSLTNEQREILQKAMSAFEESTKEIFAIDEELLDDGSDELPDSSDDLLSL